MAAAGGEMAAAGGEMAAAGGEMAAAGGEMAGGGMEASGGEMGGGGAEPPFVADCSMPNMMCYTPRASPADNPRMMIQLVNVPSNVIELVNRTNEEINMDGWVMVQGATTTPLPTAADAFTVGSIGTLRLEFGTMSGDDGTPVGGDALELAGELAIYADADTTQAENLRVYLAWGAASESDAAAHAAAQGLWPAGEYAGICGGNVGLVGVGNVSNSTGYRSIPANCF